MAGLRVPGGEVGHRQMIVVVPDDWQRMLEDLIGAAPEAHCCAVAAAAARSEEQIRGFFLRKQD